MSLSAAGAPPGEPTTGGCGASTSNAKEASA
jgi:hypothetical protein